MDSHQMISPSEFAESMRANGYVMGERGWVKMKQGQLPPCDHDECGLLKCEKPPKRIRQSSKPLMNKLEAEFYERIRHKYPNYPQVRNHAITFKLANGVNYTPDFTCQSWPAPEGQVGPAQTTAWEVKGKHSWDDAIVKIKVAAHEWLEVRWILVWKENGQWQEQRVLA